MIEPQNTDVPLELCTSPIAAQFERFFWIGAGIISLLCLALPGNVQFIADEPLILGSALLSNSKGTLATKGLMGTVGIHYGPIPTWFYQFMFLLTKNLIIISFVKNLLSILLMLALLVNLAKVLNLRRFPALLALMCPTFYMIHRALWDDGFIIPLSGAMFLAFLKYIDTRRDVHFVWGTIIAIILVYTQIKTIFIIIVFFSLITALEWRKILKSPPILATLAVSGLVVAPYGLYIARNFSASAGAKVTPLTSLWGVLSGARIFSFWEVGDYLVPEIYSPAFPMPIWSTKLLVGLSCIVGLFFCVGFFLAMRSLWQKRKSLGLEQKATLFCTCTIILFCAFSMFSRKPVLHHYFMGTWVAFFYFIWVAVDRLMRSVIGALIFVPQFISSLILLIGFIVFIDMNGGTRLYTYGATLKNQIEVIRKIKSYSRDSKVEIRVRNYIFFPTAYRALYYIVDGADPNPDEKANIVLDYLDMGNPYSGRIAITSVTPFVDKEEAEHDAPADKRDADKTP